MQRPNWVYQNKYVGRYTQKVPSSTFLPPIGEILN